MIGSTIRSAKMKAITPANEIPPDQSTAASGMLPTEQTKLSVAMIGPTRTFSGMRIQSGELCRNSVLKTDRWTTPMKPASRKPAMISRSEHLPVAAEVVRDVRPGRWRCQPRAPAELLGAGHVMLMPGVCRLRVRARLVLAALG